VPLNNTFWDVPLNNTFWDVPLRSMIEIC